MANAETFIEEIRGLLTRNMEANTQLASRVSALLQQSAREGLPSTPNELFARWLDFNLASATVISTHSTEVMRGLVDAAERSLLGREPTDGLHGTAAPRGGVSGAADATPIDLHVQGAPGETVRAPFLIANEYDRPLDVSFEATALRDDAHGEIPAANVMFEPQTLTLARGQRVVQAAIAIPAKASAGGTYRGEVRIKGYQARTIALALSVVRGERAGADADTAAAKETRSPKSRRGAKGAPSGKKSSRGKKGRSGGKAQQ